MIRLLGRDLDALRSFQEELVAQNGAEPFSTETLDALRRLIPADLANYCELDHEAHRVLWAVDCSNLGPRDPGSPDDTFWTSCWNSTLSIHHRDHRGAAGKMSDFLARRRRSGALEVYGIPGVEDVLSIEIGDDPLRTRRLMLFRTGSFTDRDRTVLDLLRAPFAIRRRAAATSGLVALLSAREREVMGLVARGRSNKEIAATLCISTATVGKHLEHVYEKLGVTNRTAAVAALGR
jgi:DNA-binding CsgD family transcriptional regulator